MGENVEKLRQITQHIIYNIHKQREFVKPTVDLRQTDCIYVKYPRQIGVKIRSIALG
jgi:hypothetical protein